MKATAPIFLILILFYSCVLVHGAAFVSLQQGIASEWRVAANQFLYFKVHQTNEPQNTIMNTIISACTGAVNVYGKICDPSKGVCNDADYVPSRDSFDFKVETQVSIPWAGQRSISGVDLCGSNVQCSTSVIYYYAITPSNGLTFDMTKMSVQQQSTSPNANSLLVTFQVYMRTYRSTDPLMHPLRFLAKDSMALQFDIYGGLLFFKQALYCKQYSIEDKNCIEFGLLPSAKYRAFYAKPNSTSLVFATEANMGTSCGMRREGTRAFHTWHSLPPFEAPKTQVQFNMPFGSEREYTYRVGVMVESAQYPGEAETTYTPLQVVKTYDLIENRVLKLLLVVLFTFLMAFIIFACAIGIIFLVFKVTRVKKSSEAIEAEAAAAAEASGEKASLLAGNSASYTA